jgi:[ribosomal protein S5]-alanine N-acetyltransferase
MPTGFGSFLFQAAPAVDQELIATGWRPPTLTTPRLVLRALEEADAPQLFKHASNPNMTPYVTWDVHRTIDDSRQFITSYAAENYLQAIPDPIAVCLRDDPTQLVGMTGCRWWAKPHQVMDMGYWVAEPYWNRGYATEAGIALLDWVFAAFTVNRIQAHHIVENKSSGRVMEKIGMKHEGTFRSAIYRRDQYWDVHFYAVLRDEWQKLSDARQIAGRH